ncbi:hypothetical protein OH76DRAFT_66671 [Lentinus brumalis]|uniref:Zn(2)-C6 fungal-type domain-containing protein n=1 Tax=Lentinus brumalis TaxID=2498619 RepID=A0A371DKL3_9APHY|nr:hypothetical protein OH76DRAFT_66671 [Polyporus brumalis]
MSNNIGHNSSSGRPAPPFDPSLLQPIVRSKRTPIACTECRRRQVKCSGTTPRCERCQKKGIECTYMPLSEQRVGGTGGSISRSGTPVTPMHGASGLNHSHGASRLAQSSGGWQTGGQAYPAGTGYPTPQGWQESQYAGSQGSQSNQAYAGVPMAYQQGFDQQATFAQQSSQGGTDMYAQSYAPQGYPSGTTYNAYGQTVSAADPRYAAYQAAQMMAGGQQSVAYAGQYAQQQVYFDPTAGQMIPADMAAQWTENSTTGFQGQHYSGQN